MMVYEDYNQNDQLAMSMLLVLFVFETLIHCVDFIFIYFPDRFGNVVLNDFLVFLMLFAVGTLCA